MTLSGSFVDYFIVFFAGFVLSLTPCVYPLIPVSIGYIGISAGGSKLRGFLLSLSYVTGIAITYSFLGAFASLTGRIFGEVSAKPVTGIIVGAVIALFGISMLDIFPLRLPNMINLINPVAGGRKGHLGAFILGLSSGLVISPCLTPALGAILAYLATKKHILYGITLLVTFAYGMGVIFILAGTFSSILLKLPKSGKWMLYIKRAFAAMLIAVGLFFIYKAIARL